MRIIYPYNEILPKRKAHDVFVFHECAALATADCDVTLLIGQGSDHDLFTHYNVPSCQHLHIQTLFLLRKNNPLGISWNLPFFFLCGRTIEKARPDAVILSVRKQAAFHLCRKLPDVQYIYEVHELSFYPNGSDPHSFEVQYEREMLELADLITVTTKTLKEILQRPPYSLTNRIEVLPLAVQARALPPPPSTDKIQIAYVGQLYAGQGLTTLLKALSQTDHVRLKVVGGTPSEVAHFQNMAQELCIADAVSFLGFIPPYELPSVLHDVHAFVAPFENKGRMPYVAHTKLCEYAEWGRPIIAPDLPIVREHFQGGALLYTPDNPTALATCIHTLQHKETRHKLQAEISACSGQFSWNTRAQTYISLIQQAFANPIS